MCGIAGIVRLDGSPVDDAVLERMDAALHHRGPDEGGRFATTRPSLRDHWQVGLVNRRLSIIDPGNGHQPMASPGGDARIVYNGEIYNFRELRKELERAGRAFTTDSDTEVALQAYLAWGDDAFARFEGMFALAIWDEREECLVLARDAVGIKPLFLHRTEETIAFASELDVLIRAGVVSASLDTHALLDFLTFEYVPGPRTILRGVEKFPPGHVARLGAEGARYTRYWRPKHAPEARDAADWESSIRSSLRESVDSHLVSDVPIGVLLSGGMDSSSILALASDGNAPELQTFSIGFEEDSISEHHAARTMAAHCGSRHHERIIGPKDALETLPKMWRHMDEPLADASLIPTHLVSELAAEHVKVVLAGDGGDELFGGYKTYQAHELARPYRRLPRPLRGLVESVARATPSRADQYGLAFQVKKFLRGASYSPEVANSIWWGAYLPEERRKLLGSAALPGDGDYVDFGVIEQYRDELHGLEPLSRIFHLDMQMYLRDNLLVKVDRMSMANSLEVRVPLLDRRMVELACRIPTALKIRGLQTKYVFRRAMAPLLPAEIRRRRKRGFNLPLGAWLRGAMREVVEDTLRCRNGLGSELFDPGFVDRLLSEHMSGRFNHRQLLWPLFVLVSWSRGRTH
jgi:asparagine synthase (glutamine-hydrolysing)